MDASGMAAKASEALKQGGARITGEAKQYANNMANLAKEKSRSMFEQQRDTTVGQMGSLAQALRSAADRLQEEGQPAGQYIGMAVDRIESLGQRLQQKDLDTLLNDAQNLARRSPTAFFAGTVIAGFLLARFMKSSAERHVDAMESSQDETPQDKWRASSVSATGAYATPPGTYSAADAASLMGASSDRPDASVGGGTGSLGADGTPSAARGTTSAGAPPSGLNGSSTGGNSYGNR